MVKSDSLIDENSIFVINDFRFFKKKKKKKKEKKKKLILCLYFLKSCVEY